VNFLAVSKFDFILLRCDLNYSC